MIRHTGVRTRALRLGAVTAGLATAASLALVLTPTAAEAGGSHGARASAPTIVGTSVSWSQKRVHTSKGRKVRATMSGSKFSSGSYLSVSLGTSKEFHSWNMKVQKSALALNAKGKGTFTPKATRTSPIAKVKIAIKPKGTPTTSRCQGTAVSKSRRVVLSGKFWVNTRSGKRGWGTVGSKTKAFNFSARGTVVWTYKTSDLNCLGDGGVCYTGSTWSVFGSTGSLSGKLNGTSVSGSRSVMLKKPAGASRFDSRSASLTSATFTRDNEAGTAKVVLKGKRSAGSTGSATINGTDASTYTTPCGSSGGQTSNTSWSSTFTNGATPLRVHDIYGSIGVKSGQYALMSVVTKATVG